MIIFDCRDVSFGYDNREVIGGLSFQVHKGDYLCLVGSNGSGKSTLIKGLVGLIKPSKGEISCGLNPNRIGYMPQQTVVSADFPAGAFEVVLSGRLAAKGYRPFYSGDDKRIAADNMKRLSIYGLRKRSFRSLSGGEKQRVLLARTLTAAQDLLVLDEPMVGIDKQSRDEMYSVLEQLNRQHGVTVIMSTHDIDFAGRYANRILHLEKSQVYFGSPDTYDACDRRCMR